MFSKRGDDAIPSIESSDNNHLFGQTPVFSPFRTVSMSLVERNLGALERNNAALLRLARFPRRV
jgi:hypothetical protein